MCELKAVLPNLRSVEACSSPLLVVGRSLDTEMDDLEDCTTFS